MLNFKQSILEYENTSTMVQCRTVIHMSAKCANEARESNIPISLHHDHCSVSDIGFEWSILHLRRISQNSCSFDVCTPDYRRFKTCKLQSVNGKQISAGPEVTTNAVEYIKMNYQRETGTGLCLYKRTFHHFFLFSRWKQNR